MKRWPKQTALTALLLVISLPAIQAWDWNSPGRTWAEDPAFRAELDWSSPDTRSLAAALFFQVNDLRIQNGKTPLVYRPALEAAALRWSKNLTEKNLLIQDPSLSGRMAEVGAGTGTFGELVSLTSSHRGLTVLQLARELADLWFSSPAHRAVLLRDDLSEGGSGVSGKVAGDYFETRTVFSFRLKPRMPGVTETENPPVSPAVPVATPPALKTEPPALNWGIPVTSLRNPRFFGSWTGGREAYRIDFSLETLLGTERPQWILGITRPRNREFSALFIKITGSKAPALLARFRNSYGEPTGPAASFVDADTEPARIYTWLGSSSELRLYEGETHTYVRLSER